jgi:hypothetical protein
MTIPGMNWYVAKLVYQIVSGAATHAEFDVQWRLIRADERAWAMEKAMTLGRLDECTLLNEQGCEVRWKFLGVVDLVLMDVLDDGARLYSDTDQPGDVTAYHALVKQRATRMQEAHTVLLTFN